MGAHTASNDKRKRPNSAQRIFQVATADLLSSSEDSKVRKRIRLEIVTDLANKQDSFTASPSPGQITGSSLDSLFVAPLNDNIDDPEHSPSSPFRSEPTRTSASRVAPPIPGLYFVPATRVPTSLADDLMKQCMNTYFQDTTINQVMFFERASDPILPDGGPSAPHTHSNGLPHFLVSLLSTLEEILLPALPARTHSLLFPPPTAPRHARQVTLNLYHPGEGISSHVDLLQRFGDGILNLSLGSGCAMRFRRQRQVSGAVAGDDGAHPRKESSQEEGDREQFWDVYLPERSVLVLSEEARYDWTHEIKGQMDDLVQGENGEVDDPVWITRGVRLSITFRWLLPGADIVGA